MDINPQNLLSIQEVLADVMVIMDDEDNRKLTPGFYNAQVKYALDELGFDISFLPVTNDYEIPEDLILEMPKGCFNLNSIHIFTGTPDSVGYQENVYWKKGAQTRGKETGMTSNVRGWNITDPFFRVNVSEWSLYYFSVQNGLMRLSDACSAFDYARLNYDGIPSKNLDVVKMIPPECRKAIVLWVTDKCAASLKLRDNKYRAVQVDAVAQLDEYGFNGAWHEAQMRLVRLDRKKFKDSILYNSNLLTH
jgi:hypothetical protein